MGKKHIIGALLATIGAFLVLFEGSLGINKGNLLIAIACLFPPIGNYYAQKAREKVSSSFIMFWRNLISGIFLLIFALIMEGGTTTGSIITSIPFLLINGIIVMGLSKILWIESIHRITITKANAMGAIAPVITLIFAFLILKEIPTVWQLAGFIPMAGGIMLLTGNKSR